MLFATLNHAASRLQSPLSHRFRRLVFGDQGPKPVEIDRMGALGQQAVVSDAVEARGQDVQQEAAQELVGAEAHGPEPDRAGGGIGGAVVLPAEADGVVVHGDEAAVGDGGAVGVAGEIGEDGGRAAEGRLGEDDPLDPAQRSQVGLEGRGDGERGEVSEEAEPGVGGGELVEEEPAEEAREHADRQEEARPAGDPAFAPRLPPGQAWARARRRGRCSGHGDGG